MKNIITGRNELLLAKIAGKEVDISTMTPPVAMNQTESLLLDIADRIDEIEDGGSGGGSSSNATFEISCTTTTNESEKQVITANKTVEEVYTAISSGNNVKTTMEVANDGGTIIVEAFMRLSCAKLIQGGITVYQFCCIANDGTKLVSDMLLGSDTLVLTEV